MTQQQNARTDFRPTVLQPALGAMALQTAALEVRRKESLRVAQVKARTGPTGAAGSLAVGKSVSVSVDPPQSLSSLMAFRREQREKDARRRAARVLRMLHKKGVLATVIGSLARVSQDRFHSGKEFRLHSDVDFLILRCPHDLKYTLESQVGDLMEGMPFDVLYQDECRAE